MAGSNETATFALRIDADKESPKEAAEALERFRSALDRSQDRLNSYRKSQALLKGSSEEVVDAKAKLKAAIEAEKATITKNNLAILKLGGSYDKLARSHKRATDANAGQKKALNAIGGPLRDATERFAMLKDIVAGVTSGWGLMAVASVAAVAGVAILAAGAATLAAKFTEWLVTSGDALRNMRLMREAASGNERNSTAWGHAIDWLSLKIATSKDELNALVVATEKSLRGTRVTGQGMVDVWSTVAQAGAAMGKDVGDALNEILTREKLTGRFGINFKAPGISELQGTGLAFEQVAKHLAKDLNVGLDEAKRALVMHTVTLSAGAKAMREAVEEQFTGINAKKLISIDGLVTKLKDNFRDWTQDASQSGGALEPLLMAGKKLVDQFGLQTDSGQRMKAAVRDYSEKLAAGLERNLPLMISMVSTGLKLAETFIAVTGAIIGFATSQEGIMLMKVALASLAFAAVAATVALAPLIASAAIAAAPFIAAGAAVVAFYETVKDGLKIDWGFIGDSIVQGITGGMLKSWDQAKAAVSGLAHNIWGAFTGPDGIDAHSPSKKFAKAGKWSVQGFAQGAEQAEPIARRALASMIDVPTTAPAPGGGGSSAPPAPASIKIEFNITGTNAKETEAVVRSASLLSELQHAIQTALRASGIPTGAPVASGG
jgi:hypothetical protein